MLAFERAIAAYSETSYVSGPADALHGGGTTAARQVIGRYLTPDGRTAVISVVAKHNPGTKQAENLVRHIRVLAPSFTSGALSHDAIYVGGAQASYTDFNDALYAHFPLIVAIVLALTYLFLFYAFRSVFLPLKAVLLNLLSVGASYGLLQLVFQRGIGSNVLGFSPESGVAGWVPIFLFAFLFGLSMDYEVFLLSRIREGWLATRKNRESVAFGLEKTGRLISSAALIMVVAFVGFLIGGELQLKEFGFGLLAAIALDASLIRLVLVPAIMRLLGTINWWVPDFLRAWASRGAPFAEEAAPESEMAPAAS
jgi:RND superfamily putative drug exporter